MKWCLVWLLSLGIVSHTNALRHNRLIRVDEADDEKIFWKRFLQDADLSIPTAAPSTPVPTPAPTQSSSTLPTKVQSEAPSDAPSATPSELPSSVPTFVDEGQVCIADPAFRCIRSDTNETGIEFCFVPNPFTAIPLCIPDQFVEDALSLEIDGLFCGTCPESGRLCSEENECNDGNGYILCVDTDEFQGTYCVSKTFAPLLIVRQLATCGPCPTLMPSFSPSQAPSLAPSLIPTEQVTQTPSTAVSSVPTDTVSESPSREPSKAPVTPFPTIPGATEEPSKAPTSEPSSTPSTTTPSTSPSSDPSTNPSVFPSLLPTTSPSSSPSFGAVCEPSTPCRTPGGGIGEIVCQSLTLLQRTRSFDSITVCLPRDEVQEALDQGATCGPCFPEIQPPPETEIPSSAPSQFCPVAADCGDSGTLFCLEYAYQNDKVLDIGLCIERPRLSTFVQRISERATTFSIDCGECPSPPPFTFFPTAQPSLRPSISVSPSTSSNPTASGPTPLPSQSPTGSPSHSPSSAPSESPSSIPSDLPSSLPSDLPSTLPSDIPSERPSIAPSSLPSSKPSFLPSWAPSARPSAMPSSTPSGFPSQQPSLMPSHAPSRSPSSSPSAIPTGKPSSTPTSSPVDPGVPTVAPTLSTKPSFSPTDLPTKTPSSAPSSSPSRRPSSLPSVEPTNGPSTSPSHSPSTFPSGNPTNLPSAFPSLSPSTSPSTVPSSSPTIDPLGNCTNVVPCDDDDGVLMCVALTQTVISRREECVPISFVQDVLDASGDLNDCGPCPTPEPTFAPTPLETCIDFPCTTTSDDGNENNDKVFVCTWDHETLCVDQTTAEILLLDPRNRCGLCDTLEGCTSEEFVCGNNKVQICHHQSTAFETLCISSNALSSHEDNHCDYCGTCESTPPPWPECLEYPRHGQE